MLPFFDDYLHAKNLRYQLILFKEIDYQRILQSDWTRGAIGDTPPKEVVSYSNFPSWFSPCQKSMRKAIVHSFKRYL